MSRWLVELYTANDGRTPVLTFIQAQNAKVRAKILRSVDLLEEFGPLLPFPHSSHLRHGIRELRIMASGSSIRILYGQCNRTFILLHALLKKSNRISDRDFELALGRLREYQRRSAQ